MEGHHPDFNAFPYVRDMVSEFWPGIFLQFNSNSTIES